MIFVTVGTHTKGFARLIKKMDEISLNIDDEIIMQIGNTDYKPKNAKFFNFIENEKILKLYKNANIIITHAGAGALLDSLATGNSIIAIPRLKKFGEHIDDQQLELTESLEEAGKIFAVYDIDKLEECIEKLIAMKQDSKTELYKKYNSFEQPKNTKQDKNLRKFLKNYLK